MRTEVAYYVRCIQCKKEVKINDEIGEHEERNFICKECLKILPEPQRKEFDNFTDYIRAIDYWSYKTGKDVSYDYNANFEKDLLEDFEVKGKKAELCFAKAWERGHAHGYTEVASEFIDLVDLIK